MLVAGIAILFSIRKRRTERLRTQFGGAEYTRAMKEGGSRRQGPEHVVEELAELTRDLQELLESYAPTWYTENLDTRVRKTLAMFNLPRRPHRTV
jgi:hypothetical protein